MEQNSACPRGVRGSGSIQRRFVKLLGSFLTGSICSAERWGWELPAHRRAAACTPKSRLRRIQTILPGHHAGRFAQNMSKKSQSQVKENIFAINGVPHHAALTAPSSWKGRLNRGREEKKTSARSSCVVRCGQTSRLVLATGTNARLRETCGRLAVDPLVSPK